MFHVCVAQDSDAVAALPGDLDVPTGGQGSVQNAQCQASTTSTEVHSTTTGSPGKSSLLRTPFDYSALLHAAPEEGFLHGVQSVRTHEKLVYNSENGDVAHPRRANGNGMSANDTNSKQMPGRISMKSASFTWNGRGEVEQLAQSVSQLSNPKCNGSKMEPSRRQGSRLASGSRSNPVYVEVVSAGDVSRGSVNGDRSAGGEGDNDAQCEASGVGLVCLAWVFSKSFR